MSDFYDLRMQLASAKNTLRNVKDEHDTIRAIAEMNVETTGKNAEDRKREITIAVSRDAAYQDALQALRDAEHWVDTAQAALDAAEDARRAAEWQIRERLAAALGGAGHEDQAFDHVTDRRVTYHGATAAYASRPKGADGYALDDLYPPR